MTSYPSNDVQFAGLVEAATAAADAHQRDLGKRKRGEENAYSTTSSNDAHQGLPKSTLTNSAAVLFREPSEKSKKYSRPPLGKVFTSLELTPESFLQLQVAAKDYMLNHEHPERKDVVGHKKSSSNNDHAKLKLYQCVEEFLQQDNRGEEFFGHSSNVNDPDAPARTFFWPEERGKIIKLLMPLLRKVVTNERQRLYAAVTRKSEPKRSGSTPHLSEAGDGPMDDDGLHGTTPDIDPLLQDDPNSSSAATMHPQTAQSEATILSSGSGALTIQVNVITRENGISKRVLPEFTISPENAGSLQQFTEGLRTAIDALHGDFTVKALLPSGLTTIQTEDDWVVSQMTILTEVWMNGQLQIVIEV